MPQVKADPQVLLDRLEPQVQPDTLDTLDPRVLLETLGILGQLVLQAMPQTLVLLVLLDPLAQA